MPTARHYPNAPITEAIIDLRVELPAGKTVADLEKVHFGLETAYPSKKNLKFAGVQFQIADQETAASASTRHIGFRFSSIDGKYIFQARLDGFTLSRLAPYESWEPFRNEARRLWSLYRFVAKPNKVIRLAVRYINRLDLPLPIADLKEYLRTVPEVSSDWPQNLAGYFMQLQIPQVDIKSFLQHSQAIIDPARPGVGSVVVDNDLFRVEDVPTEEQGLWDFLEVLRQRKNDVFEACITDKARELFQ